MSLVSSLNNLSITVVNFANDIVSRFDSGLMQIVVYFTAQLIKVLMYWYIKSTIFMLLFAWHVAKELITSLGVVDLLNDALMSLSPDIQGFLSIMGFNFIMTNVILAYTTRFVLRFLPGFK